MGWNNPSISWSELERMLSGRSPASIVSTPTRRPSTHHHADPPADGVPEGSTVPYAELHAHSHYSFLDGASSPEALAAEAARLGLTGLALTDHDGFPGAVRFAESAEDHPDLLTVYGSELSLDPDELPHGPAGTRMLVLARGESGYRRLAAALTDALLNGESGGRPHYQLEALAAASGDEWVILTGPRTDTAQEEIHRLVRLFGADHVFLELTRNGYPEDDENNARLAAIAERLGLPLIATGAVRCATREDAPLADAMSAVRARSSLEEFDPFLPAAGAAHLRSGAEMLHRFRRFPDAVHRTVPLARELAFPLRAMRPQLPDFEVPAGHTPMSWLRALVWEGAREKYALPDPDIESRIERELAVIEQKNFPGYFLIVHDIVQFARARGVLCQGRGSAANSAVCYLLGITAVDSIFYRLPFERFLSSMRAEEPDIDVDFDSARREEVIQYVFARYGRRNAAQVANVISYRPKSAIRDAAKALGVPATQQQQWTKSVEHDTETDLPENVRELAEQFIRAPRHLGIHSGGMVLTREPVGEICPIQHARMPGRTVLQWDKDDCAQMGLVKFDLLGLGMLGALDTTMRTIESATGEPWALETIPREEAAVYDMLCRADAIGVFQVESRAQLNTLPRLRPRCFYDLVIEIALIRPGPLQGGTVHPYLRRRRDEKTPTYPHPDLEPVLKRTLGIPLFQEQLMQMAMAVGGCSAEDADQLRRAMGSKRGVERIETLKGRLFEGMRARGISQASAERIYAQIEAFADFGFAESHSISFALLVYASAWFKLHYPAAFLVGLLRSQPMGFYAPRTLIEDARRHGVSVRPPDVQHSDVEPSLESTRPDSRPEPTGKRTCTNPEQPTPGPFDPTAKDTSATHRRDGGFAVRLGLSTVRGIGADTASRIVEARKSSPFRSLPDLARRADLGSDQVEALAAAGACDGLGLNRREALWAAAPAADNRERFLPGIVPQLQPPLLPILTPEEQTALDLWLTGSITDQHPLALLREELDARGTVRSDRATAVRPGTRVTIAGIVTHRQRPHTAGGLTFLTVEDESGTMNAIFWPDVWGRYRLAARTAPALLITGVLERSPDGILNVLAEECEPLASPGPTASRDFH